MCGLVDNLVMDSPERLRVVIQHGILEVMCSYIVQEDFQVKKMAALVLSNCAVISSDEVHHAVARSLDDGMACENPIHTESFCAVCSRCLRKRTSLGAHWCDGSLSFPICRTYQTCYVSR